MFFFVISFSIFNGDPHMCGAIKLSKFNWNVFIIIIIIIMRYNYLNYYKLQQKNIKKDSHLFI